ncbi:hypothetical protein SAMD00019534_125630 [Acytostelium subglobosum LB1]|uniref:hypothetical protein n=1 Tax=Acytostelium subglobosum LB1 TaxID=1410327 RepID=UPI000645000C|nr:hypothetical protein SAMD00019534_125630 [Acytostelium subglobosum LB1]GAM29387.1 hypothetical protein SAMD00019534_125630 [Acytostelium subglobosum LB1]|eukprot:XP_012747655.1 hypothetical protein SAMD00019534_125630 [Acytostelium subglobosum LB1]
MDTIQHIDNVTATSRGVSVTGQQRRRPKMRHSNFLLTVNTQKRPTSDEEAEHYAQRLDTAMDTIFTQSEHLENLFTLTPGKATSDGESPTIHRLDTTFAVEVGKKAQGGRVHSHAVIEVDHNTHIRLNMDYIRQILPPMIGVDKIYANVRYVKGMGEVKDYIEKDQAMADDNDEIEE